jgi:hypothetical protein
MKTSISKTHLPHAFKVKLALYAAGPIRPRTKYKENKLLRADLCMTLPFVPYPGLYLTMEKQKGRSTRTLYLRIRTVEWTLPAQTFVCAVDEMLGSNVFSETFEVRGSPKIERHYVELQQTLKIFGFEVQTDVSTEMALDKYADGSWITPPPQYTPDPTAGRWGS